MTVYPVKDWSNISIAESYLNKYWLDQEEYLKFWKPIQEQVFYNLDDGLNNMVFFEQYKLLALRGGSLFAPEDFLQLQECMLKLDNHYFVVIENSFGNRVRSLFLE